MADRSLMRVSAHGLCLRGRWNIFAPGKLPRRVALNRRQPLCDRVHEPSRGQIVGRPFVVSSESSSSCTPAEACGL